MELSARTVLKSGLDFYDYDRSLDDSRWYDSTTKIRVYGPPSRCDCDYYLEDFEDTTTQFIQVLPLPTIVKASLHVLAIKLCEEHPTKYLNPKNSLEYCKVRIRRPQPPQT